MDDTLYKNNDASHVLLESEKDDDGKTMDIDFDSQAAREDGFGSGIDDYGK